MRGVVTVTCLDVTVNARDMRGFALSSYFGWTGHSSPGRIPANSVGDEASSGGERLTDAHRISQ